MDQQADEPPTPFFWQSAGPTGLNALIERCKWMPCEEPRLQREGTQPDTAPISPAAAEDHGRAGGKHSSSRNGRSWVENHAETEPPGTGAEASPVPEATPGGAMNPDHPPEEPIRSARARPEKGRITNSTRSTRSPTMSGATTSRRAKSGATIDCPCWPMPASSSIGSSCCRSGSTTTSARPRFAGPT